MSEINYWRNKKGEVIHRSTCRYANEEQSRPWRFAEGFDDGRLAEALVAAPWLRLCRHCFKTGGKR